MACRQQQQRYLCQQRRYCFLDFVAKRRTNKRSSQSISDQQLIAHRLNFNSAKFINK